MTFTSLVETPRRAKILQQTLDRVDLRLATEADAEELARLFQEFFSEAGYQKRGIVYSWINARNWLRATISQGRTPHVVAIEKATETIVGAISWSLDDTFCLLPVAVLHVVYVAPEWRRSPIGRLLAEMMMTLARGDGAVALHAPLASEMPDGMKSIENMFDKLGFETIGVIKGKAL